MEAQVNEANTFPTQSYAQSFFRKLPTDNRFLQRNYVPIPMKSSLKGKTLTFVADKFQAANVYMIQDTCLEVRMVITKENGEMPPKTAKVAPRNNVLHTLFENCRLYLNDVLFSTNSCDYHYKSYILSHLTYPINVKSSLLQANGWWSDAQSFFNDCDNNDGFIARNNMFRVNGDSQGEYRKSGAKMFGKLYHDLIACESGLPPNISIKFELDYAPPSFVLQCPSTDNEAYQYKITHAALYIPVAQLSLSVYSELSTLMDRTSEGCVAIHYRRLEVRPVLMSKGNQDHYFKPLLNDGECPCKVVICFVESDAKSGSYHKNPYEFRRSWKYTQSKAESERDAERVAEKEDKVDKQINKLENLESKLLFTLENFTQMFFDKLNGHNEGTGSTSSGIERLSSYLKSTGSSEKHVSCPNLQAATQATPTLASAASVGPVPLPEERRPSSVCSDFATASSNTGSLGRNVTAAETVVQYIKGINLSINSTPIDQVKMLRESLVKIIQLCIRFQNFYHFFRLLMMKLRMNALICSGELMQKMAC